MLKMLKEIFLNRGVWVAISFCLFSACCFMEEAHGSCHALHYALLAAFYCSIALYLYKKISVAIKAAAGIFLKGVRYGNNNPN